MAFLEPQARTDSERVVVSVISNVRELTINGSLNVAQTINHGPTYTQNTPNQAPGFVFSPVGMSDDIIPRSVGSQALYSRFSKIRRLMRNLPAPHLSLAQDCAHLVRGQSTSRDLGRNTVCVVAPWFTSYLFSVLPPEIQLVVMFIWASTAAIDLMYPLGFGLRPGTQVTVLDALGNELTFPWAACENMTTFHEQYLKRSRNQPGFLFVKTKSYDVRYNDHILQQADWKTIQPFTEIYVDFVIIQREATGVMCPWCRTVHSPPGGHSDDTCTCSLCGRDFSVMNSSAGSGGVDDLRLREDLQRSLSEAILRVRVKCQRTPMGPIPRDTTQVDQFPPSTPERFGSTQVSAHAHLRDQQPSPQSSYGLQSASDVLLPGSPMLRSSRFDTNDSMRYSYVEPDGETYDISDIVEEEWRGIDDDKDLLEGVFIRNKDGVGERLDRFINKIRKGKQSERDYPNSALDVRSSAPSSDSAPASPVGSSVNFSEFQNEPFTRPYEDEEPEDDTDFRDVDHEEKSPSVSGELSNTAPDIHNDTVGPREQVYVSKALAMDEEGLIRRGSEVVELAEGLLGSGSGSGVVEQVGGGVDSVKGNGLKSSLTPTTQHHNIILFGEAGCGKSSIVNMLVGQPVAKVSNSVEGCTFQNESYEADIDGTAFRIFDTAGLNAGDEDRVPHWKAVQGLYALIRRLDGVSLLVFCLRGRIRPTTRANWIFFNKLICGEMVPTIAVVTGLEQEDNLDDWWNRNNDIFRRYELNPSGVSCVVSVQGQQNQFASKYLESQKKTWNLILDSYRREPWSREKEAWFSHMYCDVYHPSLFLFNRRSKDFTLAMRNAMDKIWAERGLRREDSEKLEKGLLHAERMFEKRRTRNKPSRVIWP